MYWNNENMNTRNSNIMSEEISNERKLDKNLETLKTPTSFTFITSTS